MPRRLPCQNPGGGIRCGKDYNIRRSSPADAVMFYGPGSRIAGRKNPYFSRIEREVNHARMIGDTGIYASC